MFPALLKWLGFVLKLAEKLNLSRVKLLVAWWSKGTPTEVLRKQRAVFAIGFFALLIVASISVPTAGWLWTKTVAQSANEARLAGEWRAINSVLWCNQFEDSYRKGEMVKAAEHQKTAIGFADSAIVSLTAVDAAVLGQWEKIQTANHLGLAFAVRARLLSESTAKRDIDDARATAKLAIKHYTRAFSLMDGIEAKDASDLPWLKSEALWWRAVALSVRGLLSRDAAELGEAREEIQRLESIFGNRFPINDEPIFRRVLKSFEKDDLSGPGGGGGRPGRNNVGAPEFPDKTLLSGPGGGGPKPVWNTCPSHPESRLT